MTWRMAAVYKKGIPIERYWNAGLSVDGTKCFLTDIDEYIYLVFDVNTGETLWMDDSDSFDLAIWKYEESHLTLFKHSVEGMYRLFGLGCNHPILEFPALNLKIDLSVEDEELLISQLTGGKAVQRLTYEAFSGDWAFATFSDDGSTIAVLEPYYVTFFRQSN